MIVTKEVEMKWNNRIKNYYINKGYSFTKNKDPFIVRVEDLPNGSNVLVEVLCDSSHCEHPSSKIITYSHYMKIINQNGHYYCMKCASKLYGKEKELKSRLKNNTSFEEWCLQNHKKHNLDMWDYELNKNIKPNEILNSSHKEFYFKCPKGIHKSELKSIYRLTRKNSLTVNCKQCESFAQWCYDNLSNKEADEILLRWDYSKNIDKENKCITPWQVTSGSEGFNRSGYWFKCLKNPNHQSELHAIDRFTSGRLKSLECIQCNSIGQYLIDRYGEKGLELYWSDMNHGNPFFISKGGDKKIFIKCQNNLKHDDYQITCSNFIAMKRCPQCKDSKGERLIRKYLNKYKIDFEPQKKFDRLTGVKNGYLSYDFYLPKHNLLIEYQGKQHTMPIDYFGGKEKFEIQQEHDRRKINYAMNNNIDLLEIWYWDFNNIEEILLKKINQLILN